VNGGVRAGGRGGMGRKDSRRPGALVHVTNPTSRNREAARQIGSLLNTLQLPKTNRLSCICTLTILTLPTKHRIVVTLLHDLKYSHKFTDIEQICSDDERVRVGAMSADRTPTKKTTHDRSSRSILSVKQVCH
jgi:hypothetical protein